MIEHIITWILLAGTWGILIYFIRRALPELVQDVLNDVGQSIGKQFKNVFADPNVKRAMSILGKESGESRASDALKSRVADKMMNQNFVIKKALEYFDLTPLEGVQLMNDPTFGPLIQNAIGSLMQKVSGGGGSSSGRLGEV